jgi:hypothetical protein
MSREAKGVSRRHTCQLPTAPVVAWSASANSNANSNPAVTRRRRRHVAQFEHVEQTAAPRNAGLHAGEVPKGTSEGCSTSAPGDALTPSLEILRTAPGQEDLDASGAREVRVAELVSDPSPALLLGEPGRNVENVGNRRS